MTEFTTVRKVRFGADARTSEGERGTVVEAVVDPTSGKAISIGVRFGMFGRVVYTGINHLTEATDRLVVLDAARSAMEATAPAGARLSAATPVTLDGKRVGKLAHITFDAMSHAPRSLVVERGVSGEYAASAISVGGMDGGTIALASGRNGAGPALTPYHRDSELRDDVRKAIESYARMRVDIGGVDIQAVDGVVWLRGHVSSELNRRLVDDLSRHVDGVAELRNLLVADPDLAAAIAAALARDPATADERIGVYAALGRVHLRGAVRTAVAREAAERIAANGHGAREIVNDLRVDPTATVLPVLAGVTGNEDTAPA